jgi:hypothetical protein
LVEVVRDSTARAVGGILVIIDMISAKPKVTGLR